MLRDDVCLTSEFVGIGIVKMDVVKIDVQRDLAMHNDVRGRCMVCVSRLKL